MTCLNSSSPAGSDGPAQTVFLFLSFHMATQRLSLGQRSHLLVKGCAWASLASQTFNLYHWTCVSWRLISWFKECRFLPSSLSFGQSSYFPSLITPVKMWPWAGQTARPVCDFKVWLPRVVPGSEQPTVHLVWLEVVLRPFREVRLVPQPSHGGRQRSWEHTLPVSQVWLWFQEGSWWSLFPDSLC